MKLSLIVFAFFFIALIEVYLGGLVIAGSTTPPPKKKSPKKTPDPLIDVHEIINDMVKKEEEIVNLSKKKSAYKTATTALASTLGLVSALLLGGIGLVLYNNERGRHPFQIRGSSKSGAAETKAAEPAPADDGDQDQSGTDSAA
ncbi:exported protein 1, putative [Plasmodium malariae]|uniref:Exported protein 1, putative n=2 Tax=Plasmodium malariae TaxID=5858 RepID=A0A1C3KCK0_PLAMA|nr:exported protein 1, putative [Plasmodium malariae]SBT71318.1 exported protein 1, putative [Plasmodium malariae]SCN12735.1 exported protein 1, putative [Plasmodium malariae]